MDGFEVVKKLPGHATRDTGISARIYSSTLACALSRQAYDLLGGPEYVILLYNTSARQIGIRPAMDNEATAYKLGKVSHSISLVRLLGKYKIDAQSVIGVHPVTLQEDMLIVQLPHATEEVV